MSGLGLRQELEDRGISRRELRAHRPTDGSRHHVSMIAVTRWSRQRHRNVTEPHRSKFSCGIV